LSFLPYSFEIWKVLLLKNLPLYLPFNKSGKGSVKMAEITITGWETRDVRFPTSLDKTGSDAMNAAGDYSAAYCILKTDSKFSGHGMVILHLTLSPTFFFRVIIY